MEPLRGERTSEAELSTYKLKAFSSTLPIKPSRPYNLRNRGVRQHWLWKTRNVSSNLWLWELTGCGLSLVLLVSIIYQIKKIDNEETWNWSWTWEPTAVLAFSVTMIKAAIMVPVASSIGQLKWHWFRNSRKLDEMEYFDEASRRMLGSIRLLITRKFWRLASVGAIITISGLVIDTLAQNAVKIQQVPVISYNSTSRVFVNNAFNVYRLWRTAEGNRSIILTLSECFQENNAIDNDIYLSQFSEEIVPTPEPCSNYLDAQSQHSPQSYFIDNAESLTGSVVNDTRSNDVEKYYNFSNIAMATLFDYLRTLSTGYGYSYYFKVDVADYVTEYAHLLAWAITFTVRTSPRYLRDLNTSSGYTWGNDYYHPDIYSRISWGYLVLPITFVISGSLFFVVTVVLSWRDTKWKSSEFAVILHRIAPADLGTVGDVGSYADMREVGRRTQVRLVSTELRKKLRSKGFIMDLD